MTRPDPAAAIATVLEAHRAPDQPLATFRAVDAGLAATVGHKLFTLLIHHPALGESERFYTNMPEAYPVGGRKTASVAPLMKTILGEGKWAYSPTKADVVKNFADHELIFSLGCHCCLNMPLVWKGQVLGSMNLLHEENWYSEADVPTIQLFAALALPAAMLISRSE